MSETVVCLAKVQAKTKKNVEIVRAVQAILIIKSKIQYFQQFHRAILVLGDPKYILKASLDLLILALTLPPSKLGRKPAQVNL